MYIQQTSHTQHDAEDLVPQPDMLCKTNLDITFELRLWSSVSHSHQHRILRLYLSFNK